MLLLQETYGPTSYHLTEDLIPGSGNRTVMQAEPGEADREELVLRKLGRRGWGRLFQFRNFYGPGWGEGRGKALSPRAIEAFYAFLQLVEFPDSVLPSIFLTDEGGLELSWEDPKGSAVQVAFQPSHVEFYRAFDHLERELPLSEVEEVTKLLMS